MESVTREKNFDKILKADDHCMYVGNLYSRVTINDD